MFSLFLGLLFALLQKETVLCTHAQQLTEWQNQSIQIAYDATVETAQFKDMPTFYKELVDIEAEIRAEEYCEKELLEVDLTLEAIGHLQHGLAFLIFLNTPSNYTSEELMGFFSEEVQQAIDLYSM